VSASSGPAELAKTAPSNPTGSNPTEVASKAADALAQASTSPPAKPIQVPPQPEPTSPGAGEPPVSIDIPKGQFIGLPPKVNAEVESAYRAAVSDPDNPQKVGELGMFYFVNQNHDLAIECFARAARFEPRQAKWLYLEGISHEAMYSSQAAIAKYREAMALKSDYPPLMLALGDLLLEDSKFDEAGQLYTRANRLLPNNPRCLWGLAACAEKSGDKARAVNLLQQALTAAPNYGQAHSALARLFKEQGDATKAGAHEGRAAEGESPPIIMDPWLLDMISHVRDPEQVIANAAMQMAAGQTQDAMRLLQSAIDADVATLEIRNNLGVLFAGAGQYEKAAEQFREILRREKDVGVLGNLGQCLMSLGKLEDAEKHLRAALTLEPHNVPVKQSYAQLLAVTRREEQAAKEFGEAVDFEPENPDLRCAFAQFLEQTSRDADARTQYEKALSLDPSRLDAHIGMVRIALRRKDNDEAEALLYSSLRRLGDVPILAEQLAYLLATRPDVARRNPASAITWAQKAVDKTGRQNPEYLHTLAIAYAADGKFPQAVEATKEALRLAETMNQAELARTFQASLKRFESGKSFEAPNP
jgi:tetratricopeptide (TPR) repeat protein